MCHILLLVQEELLRGKSYGLRYQGSGPVASMDNYYVPYSLIGTGRALKGKILWLKVDGSKSAVIQLADAGQLAEKMRW
uniref:Defensin beta 115 n=1 Tax=Pipistrellus kuhlii TaxID=59472 RepID=A0A7J7Y8E0_PIPKU|nr:defensin beta 115 [Pipistrellus kuhlii]